MEKNQLEDIKKKNDHCFVAGTLITTDKGQIPIEDTRPGDMVLTRVGFKPVEDCGPTKIAQTYVLEFSNGSALQCTGNHPIFTRNRGFIRADELTCDDQLEALWSKKKRSITRESSLGAIPNLAISACDSILSAARSTISTALGIFTGKFGSLTMAQSPISTISITRMRTRSITTYPSWNAFTFTTTAKSTEKQAKTLRIDDGQSHQNTSWFAPFVRKALKITSLIQNIVRNGAEPKPGHTAKLLKRRTSTVEQVYNLRVESQHEYFAEGILVANSYDSIRYALMSIASPAGVDPQPVPQYGTLGEVEKYMDTSDESEDPDFY
jgi:hypothetical protein